MIDTPSPAIQLLDQDSQPFTLDALTSKHVLVYFSPKDMTPGCTTQACAIESAWSTLTKLGCSVIGISRDSPKRHRQFIDKYQLPFPLLSDPEGEICQAFGVWIEKSMFGKRYMGIERSSFLLDSDRIIRKAWRKVKPAEHIDLVIDYLIKQSSASS